MNNGTHAQNGRSRARAGMEAVPNVDSTPSAAEIINNEVVDEPTSTFPLHRLPPVAASIAQACVDAYRVPPTLAGCCALGLLSASVGAGLQVRSLADRCSRANLYLFPTAASGSGKSETFRAIMGPFFAFQDTAVEDWKRNSMPKLKALEGALKIEISSLESAFRGKRGTKPTEEERQDLLEQLAVKQAALSELGPRLQPPSFYVEDTTEQKLESLMQQPGETLSCLSDDARQVTDNIMGRNRGDGQAEDGFWVKAWTGGRHKVDRANGRNVLLLNPCLAALLFVQDDKLRAMLARPELIEGGFLPRALICRTGCEPHEIDRNRGGISPETLQGWKVAIFDLLNKFRQASEPCVFEPSPKAARLMDEHFNALVPRRCAGGDLADVASFPARWTEQAWRISVCLHAGLHGGTAANYPLAAETAESALVLSDWFADQQLAILGSTRTENRRARLTKLHSLLADYVGGEATLRDLARRNGFNEAEVRLLAGEFPSLLAVVRRETHGRPSEVAVIPRNGIINPSSPAKPAKGQPRK